MIVIRVCESSHLPCEDVMLSRYVYLHERLKEILPWLQEAHGILAMMTLSGLCLE